MTNVGGDPSAMTGGAKDLHKSGQVIHAMEPHLSTQSQKAASGAGDPDLAGALSRFGSAWSHVLGDTGTQILLASQLAANAATDLTVATSDRPPR